MRKVKTTSNAVSQLNGAAYLATNDTWSGRCLSKALSKWSTLYYKSMLQEIIILSKFHDKGLICDFMEFANSIKHFVEVNKFYIHTIFEDNASIQYQFMAWNKFWVIITVCQQSWFGQHLKKAQLCGTEFIPTVFI